MNVGGTKTTAAGMQLRDYLLVLRRRKGVLLASVVGVVSSAIVMSLLQTPVYQASSRVLLEPSQSLFAQNQEVFQGAAVENEIQVIRSQPVQDAVRRKLGVAPPVAVRAIGQTSVVEVSAESTNPGRAATIANTYVEEYIGYRRKQAIDTLLAAADELQSRISGIQKQIDELSAQLAEIPPCTGTNPPPNCTQRDPLQHDRDALVQQQVPFRQKYDQLQVDVSLKNGGARVVTPAVVPTDPVRPQPLRNGLLGLGVGVLFGVSLALLFEHLDDSVKGKEDLERLVPDLPVLGMIPSIPSWKNRSETRLVSRTEPTSPTAEAYRSLRTSIQFVGLEKATRVLQITSPNASEGKTTTVANLAIAMARAGKNVVVLSCDLRRPRIHEFFELSNSTGFTSVLLGDVPLAKALQRVPGEDRLTLLASGSLPPNPSELLSGRGTADILASLRENFDIVLVDSPPVVPVTDAAVLSPKVDATFIVVTVGTTTTKQATRAIELLRQVSAPLVGLILNGVPPGGGGYGYGYTYGYTSLDAATVSRKARLPTNGNGAIGERPILTPKATRPLESTSDGDNGP